MTIFHLNASYLPLMQISFIYLAICTIHIKCQININKIHYTLYIYLTLYPRLCLVYTTRTLHILYFFLLLIPTAKCSLLIESSNILFPIDSLRKV